MFIRRGRDETLFMGVDETDHVLVYTGSMFRTFEKGCIKRWNGALSSWSGETER